MSIDWGRIAREQHALHASAGVMVPANSAALAHGRRRMPVLEPRPAPPPAGFSGKPSEEEDVDTHEIMKREIFKDPSGKCGDHFEKSFPCPSDPYGVSDHYVVLDSLLAIMANPYEGKYQFNITPQQKGQRKKLGMKNKMEQVYQIQLWEGYMPLPLLLEDIDVAAHNSLTLTANAGVSDPRTSTNPITGQLSQLAHGARVRLHLTTVGEQSHFDFHSRHHFDFVAELEGTVGEPNARMKLTPINQLYTFTEPIKAIAELGLQFYGPDEPLRFPPDEISGVTLSTDAGSDILVTVPESFNDRAVDLTTLVVPGDRIFLEGVDITVAGNLRRDISDYLNSLDGLFVGATITATTLELDPQINPGLGAGTTLTSSTTITLRIAKNRMVIPMRSRGLVSKFTNLIAP